MKRVKINTPYDPEIQVPAAVDKARKQAELDALLAYSDKLADMYEEQSKDKTSSAFVDKNLFGDGLVLFDRRYEVVVYKYRRSVRGDLVAKYDK